MDWSIPPEAVPVYLYPFITLSMNYSFGPSFPPLAWNAARAEQTQSAEELDKPAAVGMLPEIITSRPFNDSLGISLTPARYPALKYLR